MNYFQITKCDMLNGDGIRVVLWLAGCSHHCKGCQNSYTWDCNAGLPFTEETKTELFEALNKDYITGITFSGGDPLFHSNRKQVAELIKEIKEQFPTKTIWLYTGYMYEELKEFEEMKPVLSNIDVIIDGEFVESLKDVNYHWAGSTNQRVLRRYNPIRAGETND
jgi:anaerobic ribonucleoside-triphosphate reductase activating protein